MTTKPTEKADKFVLDKTLLIILGLFMVTSLVAIYASAPHLGGNATRHIIMQGLFYGVSFGVLIFICLWGVDRMFSMVNIFYAILLLMMILLLVDKFTPIPIPFSAPSSGTWAWYNFGGISFQPSEFMKIILVMKTALTIDKHNKEKEKNGLMSDLSLFLKIGIYLIPVLILNFLQPDTGVPLIMVISIMVMVLVGGVDRKWFLFIAVAGVVGYFGIIYIYHNHIDWLTSVFGPSYRLDRFYAWLDYEKYQQGVGYQLYRSIISLGSAGLTGVGFDASVIDIPAAHTDFIFAVFGTTFGFVGSLFLIALCFILNLKLILVAIRSQHMVGRYAIAGVVGIFIYQQVQNIGMMIGLLPITGITLPLISYGGSSLLSYMIAMSIPFAVSSHTTNNPNYEAGQVPLKTLE